MTMVIFPGIHGHADPRTQLAQDLRREDVCSGSRSQLLGAGHGRVIFSAHD